MDFASIMSKEYADKLQAAGKPEQLNQQPVGTGPFMFVDYQKDAVIRYKANPDYWGGKQTIDDLVFAITPDASVRLQKLKAGECQIMAYPNPADVDGDEERPEPQGRAAGGPQRRLPRLQHAAEAVRRRARAQGAQHGGQQAGDHRRGLPGRRRRPAKNPIPPTMWSYNKTIKDDPYDPEAAKKLLAEAGVNDLHDEVWAHARARPYMLERAARGRADAGGSRQGRRRPPRSSPTNGRNT